MFIAALAILASCLGCGFVETVPQLIGTRIVLGVGMGCKASVIPIYSAEISPGRIRGKEWPNAYSQRADIFRGSWC